MWSRSIDGRPLTFHLAGINNQNFIMRDEETGSWWQQVTGEAIYGPLKGKRLEPVLADEVAFDVWHGDHPATRVLRPDDSTPWRRFSDDWEAETGKLPVPAGSTSSDDPLPPREIVFGVRDGSAAVAYPLASVVKAGVLVDTVGAVPVALVVDADGASVRAFDRRLDGRELHLFHAPDAPAGRFVDSETGSVWDFTGTCVAGELAGKRLVRVQALRDYWFDWKTYNPATRVFKELGTKS